MKNENDIRPKCSCSGYKDLLSSLSAAADIAGIENRAVRSLPKAGGAKNVTRKFSFIVLFFVAVAALGAIYVHAGKGLADSPAASQPQTTDTRVIAYYFHVTVRCTTCRTIESYSREVIEQKFGADIAKDRLQYRLVNIQLPENRHFVKDYQLFTKSLVLVRFDKGRQAEYKVLNDTWELVEDKSAMQGYVEREVRDYLRRLS